MAIAVALVTGCSAVIVNESPGPRASYFDGDFEYAVQKGSVVAVIAGNPFNIPKNRFDTAVRQAMRDNVSTGNARFVASGNSSTVPPYKVVVAFNPRPGVSDDELCRQGAGAPTNPAGGSLSVRMAFCYGDSNKSATSARISGVQNVGDDGFRALVKATTLAMIPLQDGEEQGEPNVP